jgi:hypothetical protein
MRPTASFAAFIEDRLVKTIGVIGAIGDDRSRGQAGDETTGGSHVILLARSDCEADRQAERIYDGMQLGAEAAARAAESLGFNAPLLRRAPAAWA